MKLKSISMKLSGKITSIGLFLMATIIAPIASFAQGGPGGPGGGGSPEAVPFDDDMNIAFLTAGVLFAAFVIYKQWRKKSVVQ